LSGVVIAAHYESPLKEAIWQLKYGGARYLSRQLAELLRDPLSDTRAKAITAVPLHKRREWWRGYNQAELLAKNLKGESLPYSRILKRVKLGKPQVELGRKERLKNLDGAFKTTATPPSRVLLIDDVATTGATLEACARELRSAGAREVWVAVLARHK
jgi:ComF family protein